MLAVFALALPATGTAFVLPCSFSGAAGFAQTHPQANDVLQFAIGVYPYAPPQVVLVKTTIASDNHIDFDAVITIDSAAVVFSGYQVYAVTGSQTQAVVTGALGPLPAGQYSVATALRIYDPSTGFSDPCQSGPRIVTLTVYPDDGLSSVVEYYDLALDHYFLTQNPAEIAGLDVGAHPGWIRTGQSFLAYRPNQNSGNSVSRFYRLPSAGFDTHFFTNNEEEIIYMTIGPPKSMWTLETGDAFDLDIPTTDGRCQPGEIPVYRLWNQRVDSNHRYTTDRQIKQQMIDKGYVAEGFGVDAVMMCAFTRQVP